MHGVKRLFAWMIPRFDEARFNVSLVSLRKKDLSEETLESLGVDIEYLDRSQVRSRDAARAAQGHRPEADRRPAPARLRRDDVRPLAGAMRRLPTILHEHANLTDTPWFQKVADSLLEPYTDIALAVSRSTADFVRDARLVRPERSASSISARPWRSSAGVRDARGSGGAREQRSASDRATSRSARSRALHDSKGNEYLVEAARLVLDRHPEARFFLAGEGPLRPALEAQAATAGLGDRFVFAGFVKDVAATLSAFDLSVFPSLWEGTPLTAFEALASGKAIVSTDADGLTDILDDGQDRVDRAQARCGRAGQSGSCTPSSIPTSARHGRPRARASARRFRHQRVRQEDGAAVPDAPRLVAADTAAAASCAKTCRS